MSPDLGWQLNGRRFFRELNIILLERDSLPFLGSEVDRTLNDVCPGQWFEPLPFSVVFFYYSVMRICVYLLCTIPGYVWPCRRLRTLGLHVC